MIFCKFSLFFEQLSYLTKLFYMYLHLTVKHIHIFYILCQSRQLSHMTIRVINTQLFCTTFHIQYVLNCGLTIVQDKEYVSSSLHCLAKVTAQIRILALKRLFSRGRGSLIFVATPTKLSESFRID